MSEASESYTSYHYAGDNPVMFNDPLGDIKSKRGVTFSDVIDGGSHGYGGGGIPGFSGLVGREGSRGDMYNVDLDFERFKLETGFVSSYIANSGDYSKGEWVVTDRVQFFNESHTNVYDSNGFNTGNAHWVSEFVIDAGNLGSGANKGGDLGTLLMVSCMLLNQICFLCRL